MKKLLLGLTAASLFALAPVSAFAGPYEDGFAAYNAKNYNQAMQLWRPIADKGNAKAQFNIAMMYANNEGVTRSYPESAKWMRMAAGQGHAQAQYLMGTMYNSGLGITKDRTLAVKWFEKSAAQGYEDGIAALKKYKQKSTDEQMDILTELLYPTAKPNVTYEQGLSALKVGATDKAFSIFSTLSKQGNANAQSDLGTLYASGNGRPVNMEMASIWWRKAADQGHIEAQINLGIAYYKGIGVPQSFTEAAKWFQKPAQQGNTVAQYHLGLVYKNRQDAAQSNEQSVKWYQMAAAQGYADAQANLGFMYYRGTGISQNSSTAIMWFKKAAAQGQKGAIGALKQLGVQ